VETDYPWEGAVRLRVEEAPEAAWSLLLRLPGWCEQPRLVVNGAPVSTALRPGSYAEVRREWRAGDVIELDLPMPVQPVVAHPRITDTTGRVALRRGPLVYCLEGVDHPGVDLRDVALPAGARLDARRESGLLGGVVVVRGDAVETPPAAWDPQLYAAAETLPAAGAPERRPVPLVAVPYYAWANRAPGQMQVWLHAGE
jgi:hypothetical protein